MSVDLNSAMHNLTRKKIDSVEASGRSLNRPQLTLKAIVIFDFREDLKKCLC